MTEHPKVWVWIKGRSLYGICRKVTVRYKKLAEGETEKKVSHSTGIIRSQEQWKDLLDAVGEHSCVVALVAEDGVSKSGGPLGLAKILEYKNLCDVYRRLVRENAEPPELEFDRFVHDEPGIPREYPHYCSIADVERYQKQKAGSK